MATPRVLVVASPYEMEGLRRAGTAAGATVMTAEAHDDLALATATFAPDAIVVADGGTLRDPLGTLRRLRAAAGARTPVVFLAEARAVPTVERLVEAVFRRPAQPETLISRALALTVHPEPAARPLPLEVATPRLRRVAASIDEALNAEMLSALRDVHAPAEEAGSTAPPAGEAPPARATALSDALPLLGDGVLAAPLADLFLWADLLASGDGQAWIAEPRTADAEQAGDLADVDAPMLLGRFFMRGTTGRLLVTRGEIEKTVYFEAGRPVLATSNDPTDRLVETMLRSGRITAVQHRMACRAAEQATSPGRKMGALLVDLGLIEAADLLAVVREHYEDLALSLFAWTEGRWRVEPGVMAHPAQIRLLRHPAALVREGLRRGHPQERLWERLGSPRNVFALARHPGTADLLAAIAGDERERLVLLLLDGIRPLDEVAGVSGLPEGLVAQIAFCAWAFGLLEAAPAAGEADRRLPAGARDRELERERILARYALALDGDYFEVLGLPRRASGEEVRRAYDLLCRALSPGALGLELSRAMAVEVAVIREVVEEGLRVLGSEALRVPYEAALPPERSFDADTGRSTQLALAAARRPGGG